MLHEQWRVRYDKRHRALEAIRQRNLPISEVIRAVCNVYQMIYGQTPYDINCGNCEEFAHDVIGILNGGKPCEETEELSAWWNDELDPQDEPCHKFIRYRGRYYDSQSPEGVDDWRDLPCFQGSKQPFRD